MSEPVLERSVLERKEREELLTIARALGAEPSSRLKKADLVDLVLRSAGLDVGGPADDAAGDRSDAAPAAGDDAGTDRRDAAPDARADDDEPSGEDGPDVARAPRGRGRGRPSAAETAADDGDGAGGDDAGDDRDEPSADGGQRGRTSTPAPTQGRLEGTAGRSTAGRPSEGRSPDDRAAGNGRGDSSRGDSGRGDSGRSDSGRGDAPRSPSPSGRAARDGAPGDRPGPRQAQRDAPQPGGQRTGNQSSGNQSSGNQSSGNQSSGNQSSGNQSEQSGENGADRDQNGVDDEGGNRRRRRRNRERGDAAGERPEGGEEFNGEPVACSGLLDLRDEGYGFLRVKGYLPHRDDVYVSVRQVRQLGLRKGDHLAGASRPAARQEKNPALLRIDEVNGQDPEEARRRPRFEDLTPLFPDDRLRLESPADPTNMTARIVDLVSPIGKGQRGLIVSPPKAGKTTILKQIVKSIERNSPEVHLMVLLVDERPEEVTDMRRSTQGEVIASTFDRPSDEHTTVSELVLERAKRLVEDGKDVVIVLDGITRLARAYNLAAPATGRIMSGGIDTGALYPPKKFFGAARNIEEGGSLTILATALIETGSKMDEVIFEEFKGTGNMELRLDRRLAERRIYPAIDVDASSTRHEELLFTRQQLQQVWRVRRALHALSSDAGSPAAALERLMDGMKTFRTNDEFLAEAAKAGGPAA